jgi:hypothetical protein
MGEEKAARTHLVGLATVAERFKAFYRKDAGAAPYGIDATLGSSDDDMQLYLSLVTQDVVLGTSTALIPPFPNQGTDEKPTNHVVEHGSGTVDRKLALWLTTYYLLTSYKISPQDFDINDLLDYLRLVTTVYGGCLSPASSSATPANAPAVSWNTTPETRQAPSAFDSSIEWGSTIATGGTYLHVALGLPWACGARTLEGPLCWVLPAMQKDVASTEHLMVGSPVVFHKLSEGAKLAQALWLWKVLLAASVVKSPQHSNVPPPPPGSPGSYPYYTADVLGILDDDDLYALISQWWDERLRRWSRATGISKWTDASDILTIVVWPKDAACGILAREIWEHAVNGQELV